jgi:hypothetical protein
MPGYGILKTIELQVSTTIAHERKHLKMVNWRVLDSCGFFLGPISQSRSVVKRIVWFIQVQNGFACRYMTHFKAKFSDAVCSRQGQYSRLAFARGDI